MSRSLAILLVLAIAVLCFTGGLLVLIGGSPRVVGVEHREDADASIDENLQMIIELQTENDNLRGQIEVLEQMVATQQAQLDEINAVIEQPGGDR